MVDYIVVGGGSAGCVLASRLSENPNNQVLLLEAGPDNKHPMIHMPGGAAECIKSDKLNWQDYSLPQKALFNRRIFVPRGKMLGGSSGLNGMVYVRGHAEDYNSWYRAGNKGWSYKEVLPYFKRSECNVRGVSTYHNNAGDLQVVDSPSSNPIFDKFVSAGIEAGFPACEDFNGAEQEGFGRFQATITPEGQRCSSALAFLNPAVRARKNLTILYGAQVSRLLVEDNRAVAVEYQLKNKRHRVRANKEIILCSGAIKSPQILQLSGIGRADDLASVGITPKVNLPGVGYNLQEHLDITVNYEAHRLTHNREATRPHLMVKTALEYFTRKQGLAACNMIEGGAFLKTRKNLKVPDIQLHFVPLYMTGLIDPVPKQEGITLHACLLRPKSRGSVKLFSKDPADKPLIDFNFLDDPRDMEVMVAAYRILRDVMESSGWGGVIGQSIRPPRPLEAKADIEAYIRSHADTVFHPVGTCKMGNDDMAVVDHELRVHGMKGLRVADASIMPTITGGNTNAPAIMIGEKCADLILGQQLPVALIA